MKEKLLRTKKELEKEYNLNSKEIRNIKEKIKILESNTLDHKFYTFAKSYAISLPVSMILSIIMGFNFPTILSSVIGTNAFNIIRYLFIGPVIPGVIIERTISKVNSKKLNRFSSAKTDEQKREEILEYKLEKQKLEDKNIAISEAYDFASDLETKVDVCNLDFGNSNMSKQDQEKNNKNLRENISKKERELEISSTQLLLNEDFVMLRSNLGKIATIGIPVGVGLLSYLFTSVGSLIINPSLLTSSSFNTIGLIGGGIGALASITPTYIRNKQNRKLFNKFNNKLADNKLPENTDNDIIEKRKIVSKGNKIIEELATAHLVYQDSTRELERIVATEIIEEETALDIAIRGAEKMDELDLRSEQDERMKTIMQVAHEEETKEIEGPTLVKRK